MIAETLAGIALVKSAVDGIKSAINTAKDVSEVAGHIDNLLTGEKQVQQQRSKKSGNSIGDQFGIKSVAQEVIDARLAQEQVNEMRTLVDMRFGPGTWQSIVDERARRIQEAKEAARKAKIEEQRAHDEMMESLKNSVLVGLVVAIGMALFFAFIIFLPK